MKKRTIIIGVLAVILSIYFWIAFFKTRGIGIYTISYTLGRILVITYFPTAILALISWLIFIVNVKKEIKPYIEGYKEKRKAKQETKKQDKSAVQENNINLQHKKEENNEGSGNKISGNAGFDIDATSLDEGSDVQNSSNTVVNMVCPGCGAKIEPNQMFCGECGTKIG